jgi:hypothetical protein
MDPYRSEQKASQQERREGLLFFSLFLRLFSGRKQKMISLMRSLMNTKLGKFNTLMDGLILKVNYLLKNRNVILFTH